MLYHPTPRYEAWRQAALAALKLPVALFDRYRRWEFDRSEMHRLCTMDDRILADMGISRSEIASRLRTERRR